MEEIRATGFSLVVPYTDTDQIELGVWTDGEPEPHVRIRMNTWQLKRLLILLAQGNAGPGRW